MPERHISHPLTSGEWYSPNGECHSPLRSSDQQPHPQQYGGDQIQQDILRHGGAQFRQVVGVLQRAQRGRDGEDQRDQADQRPGGSNAGGHADDDHHVGEKFKQGEDHRAGLAADHDGQVFAPYRKVRLNVGKFVQEQQVADQKEGDERDQKGRP